MEEQEPERTKDTRRIKKKKKSEKMEGTQYILNRGQITCTVLTKTQKNLSVKIKSLFVTPPPKKKKGKST